MGTRLNKRYIETMESSSSSNDENVTEVDDDENNPTRIRMKHHNDYTEDEDDELLEITRPKKFNKLSTTTTSSPTSHSSNESAFPKKHRSSSTFSVAITPNRYHSSSEHSHTPKYHQLYDPAVVLSQKHSSPLYELFDRNHKRTPQKYYPSNTSRSLKTKDSSSPPRSPSDNSSRTAEEEQDDDNVSLYTLSDDDYSLSNDIEDDEGEDSEYVYKSERKSQRKRTRRSTRRKRRKPSPAPVRRSSRIKNNMADKPAGSAQNAAASSLRRSRSATFSSIRSFPPAVLDAFSKLPLGIGNSDTTGFVSSSDNDTLDEFDIDTFLEHAPRNERVEDSEVNQTLTLSQGSQTLASNSTHLDYSVTFNSIGGLDDHIMQLKEMVMLPMLYPELFTHMHIRPPRGVLFHGPPGTGKTLLARALAVACSTQERKVSFFLRKGSDCLSKWVGEAERQLRLLFQEARKNQPSIIFFDEIDGLAPVRSQRQDQTHASIVSTLLALMDGLDDRGQVIVIGATNRPDSLDPALRRPGRFDREFYFPLPDRAARYKILSIHTRHWKPPISRSLLMHLASSTNGYGGADLQALCTEAAMNAIRRTFPDIFKANEKLSISPENVQVTAEDFTHALMHTKVSTRRSKTAIVQSLDTAHSALLQYSLNTIVSRLNRVFQLHPSDSNNLSVLRNQKNKHSHNEQELKNLTGLMHFHSHRPKLIVTGPAVSFDLGTLFNDPEQHVEAKMIELFSIARQRQPSILYIPDIDTWQALLPEGTLNFFSHLHKSIPPLEKVLLLAFSNVSFEVLPSIIQSWFSPSESFCVRLEPVPAENRRQFFDDLLNWACKFPLSCDEVNAFSHNRPTTKRTVTISKNNGDIHQNRIQKMRDLRTKNKLRLKLNSILEQLRSRYQRFKKPLIDLDDIYVPAMKDELPTSIIEAYQYEVVGSFVVERATNKRFTMMNLAEIERRVWNGYYAEPKEFFDDVKAIVTDATASGDFTLKRRAKEMLINVQFAMEEVIDANFLHDCKSVALRASQKNSIATEDKPPLEPKDKNEEEHESDEEIPEALQPFSVYEEIEDSENELSMNELTSEPLDDVLEEQQAADILLGERQPSGTELISTRLKLSTVDYDRTLNKITDATRNYRVDELDYMYVRMSRALWRRRKGRNQVIVLKDAVTACYKAMVHLHNVRMARSSSSTEQID
ncbi:ATPase with bromodomain protein [Schizosaccharomyces japonicus yFS275]|uniref:ATPase with bromodomain protein n=1 Tax=Schizosaccharomyces japonicus (strain yFS275 / FY16936) TaxID=402676 RepID=B6K7I0_SCHJY|nr:ATPase with bromodomain protein [Schizosaccharomyces japonicus yFS275]EEB09484.1 ATPase with bromodomain protein [Schizosaccharomyces japonicus yFS275]